MSNTSVLLFFYCRKLFIFSIISFFIMRVILTEEQLKELKKKYRRKKKKDCSAMAQVGGKVNSGIMLGITAGGMFEEGAEPESNSYFLGGEVGKHGERPIGGTFFHAINESPDINCEEQSWRSENAIPFIFLREDGKLHIGKAGQVHSDIVKELVDDWYNVEGLKKEFDAGYQEIKCPYQELADCWDELSYDEACDDTMTGRYWNDTNILSLWRTPVNNPSKLYQVVDFLSRNGVISDTSKLIIDYWDKNNNGDGPNFGDDGDSSVLTIPYKWFKNGTFRSLFGEYDIIAVTQFDEDVFMVETRNNNLSFIVTFNGDIMTTGEYQKQKYGIDFTKDDDENFQPAYSFELEESVNKDFDLTNEMHSLMEFMSNKIQIKPFPEIHLNNDEQEGLFIRTGYYEPSKKSVTLFVDGRHPKDILRSLAHELIHHNQNLRDPEFDWGGGGDLEQDDRLRKLEGEAYLKGNIYFREWTEAENGKKKTLNESKRNDEGKVVPEKCDKCGGDVVVQIHGEPVYICKDCGKYFGTMPFSDKLNESIDIKKALKNLKKRRDPDNIEKWDIDEGVDRNAMYMMIYAKHTYGTTEDFDSAGFILLNGELLDFGNYDDIFRQAHGALDLKGANFRDFINYGNIRVNPQSPGIELSKEPTSEQYEKISEMVRRYSDRGLFYVDVVGQSGNNIWNRKYTNQETQLIKTDLLNYFKDGKIPQDGGNPVLGGFSLRDFLSESEIAELEDADVDLSSFNIKKRLNPKFWKDGHLDSRIRLKLMDIADAVMEYIDVDWFDPEDVIMTGSLANYNWNDEYSDIDLHILIDFDDIHSDRETAKKYLDKAMKAWKSEHSNITIYGFPVEVYIQDADEPHASTGVYSIDKDKWLVEPDIDKLRSGKVNKKRIRKMVAHYGTKIDNLCDIYNETNDDEYRVRKLAEKVDKLFDAMKRERKKGLNSSSSEINDGNIMYKALRRSGYLQKIIDLKHKVFDKMHSLLKEEKGEFKVYMMVGIPGAGKSTWIKNNVPDLPVVSRDIIRAELGMCEPGDKYAGTPDEENEVTMHEYMKMGEYCNGRQSFVIDDTNTHKKYRKQMIDFLREHGAKVVFVHLDTPLDVCKKRREGQIPPEVMDRIYRRRVIPSEDEYDEIINV